MKFLYELEPGAIVTIENVSYELATKEYFASCSEGEIVPEGMLPLCVPMFDNKLYWVFADESATLDEEENNEDCFSRN